MIFICLVCIGNIEVYSWYGVVIIPSLYKYLYWLYVFQSSSNFQDSV